MKLRMPIVILVVLAFLATACDSGEAELSTTSSVVTGTTEVPDSGTTTTTTPDTGSDTTTGTTLVGETITSHEVKVRIPTDNGEILYIVIPPGAYTDVDIQNFLVDLKESNPDLWGAEIFDDAAAADAYTVDESERTEEQQALLEQHHFVSLLSGDTVRFQGPFSEFGEYILAS